MSAAAPFSRSAVVLLITCAAALFAASILLHAYDNTPESSGKKSAPGSKSTSAVGCAGFYEVLRRLERPVSRSAGNTLAMVGGRGTLIVAEPDLARIDEEDARKLLAAPRLLLVLPKWWGIQDRNHPAWVKSLDARPLDDARRTLALVTTAGDVYRDTAPAAWKVNELGVKPDISGVAQLLRSNKLRPVIGSAEGMLVGELMLGDKKIWILSDPDVIANMGIGRGDNAAFAVALVDALRSWNNTDLGAPVVFDETVHGFRAPQGSPIKLLFRFPFVIVTILACAACLLLVAAGTDRFGAPLRPKPVLDFGKAGLIANGARLLDYAGHQTVVLRRYVRMTVKSAARALHAPAGLSDSALAEWLDRVGKARGVQTSCAAILTNLAAVTGDAPDDLERLFACAGDIHKWKGELLHGSATDRRHR